MIKKPGEASYLLGCFICLLGGWLGCCLIPCQIKAC